MRVPMRVISPFRLSERTEVRTSVEPFSEGASRAAHSSRPALSDCNVPCSCTNSHSSSRACDAACSWLSAASSMGGHTAVDMAMRLQGTLTRTGLGRRQPDRTGQDAMGGHRLVAAISLLSEPGTLPAPSCIQKLQLQRTHTRPSQRQ